MTHGITQKTLEISPYKCQILIDSFQHHKKVQRWWQKKWVKERFIIILQQLHYARGYHYKISRRFFSSPPFQKCAYSKKYFMIIPPYQPHDVVIKFSHLTYHFCKNSHSSARSCSIVIII